ncbi:hypothetical protein QVD17_14257 [Tagetes erecta]|uniref:Transmembrane protein n=1 Tax=Tagetes erecta TaxID=13708 RepID=A0AAD8KWP8_TARER|nr:hypothetical protein QVD17_14257 [Tagetes erecta]
MITAFHKKMIHPTKTKTLRIITTKSNSNTTHPTHYSFLESSFHHHHPYNTCFQSHIFKSSFISFHFISLSHTLIFAAALSSIINNQDLVDDFESVSDLCS